MEGDDTADANYDVDEVSSFVATTPATSGDAAAAAGGGGGVVWI